MQNAPNLGELTTPGTCLADFSLVPIGDSSTSYAQQIAAVQRLCQKSSVKYSMHATGTTLEGPWDQVNEVIGCAHSLVHRQGTGRIQSDIRLSTRVDKPQSIESEIASVNKTLAA